MGYSLQTYEDIFNVCVDCFSTFDKDDAKHGIKKTCAMCGEPEAKEYMDGVTFVKLRYLLICQKIMCGPECLKKMQSSFTKTIDPPNLFKTCRNCMTMEQMSSKVVLKKCMRCEGVRYCSKECQKADWKRHKPECKVVKKKEEKKDGDS